MYYFLNNNNNTNNNNKAATVRYEMDAESDTPLVSWDSFVRNTVLILMTHPHDSSS